MMPLFVLPFDHRSSFAKTLLGFDYPPSKREAKEVIKMKHIVFDAFLFARRNHPLKDHMAILVDEEFGTSILKKAKRHKIPFALTTEKSGQDLFDFEYDKNFGEHLRTFRPTYAKALVRYNPAQHKKNREQLARLKQLSQFCRRERMGLMLELLVNGAGSHIDLTERSMQQIIKAGVTPTLWKIEGLASIADWKRLDQLTKTDMIVLGRGESTKAVEKWITTAAKSGIPDGFAIGRTIFMKPLESYRDKKITRREAINRIANNYLHFISLWQNKHTKS